MRSLASVLEGQREPEKVLLGERHGQVRGHCGGRAWGHSRGEDRQPRPHRALGLLRETEGQQCVDTGQCCDVGHQRRHRLHVSAALSMPPFSRSWAPRCHALQCPGCCLWYNQRHWHHGHAHHGPELLMQPIMAEGTPGIMSPAAWRWQSLNEGIRLLQEFPPPGPWLEWAGRWPSRWHCGGCQHVGTAQHPRLFVGTTLTLTFTGAGPLQPHGHPHPLHTIAPLQAHQPLDMM